MRLLKRNLVYAGPMIFFWAQTASAQEGAAGGTIFSLCYIFKWIYALGVVIAGILVVVALYQYATAAGDLDKFRGAGKTLRRAIIFVFIAVFARAVPVVFAYALGSSITVDPCTAVF